MNVEERVEVTIGCRDADHIPKIDGAGSISSFKGETIQSMHNGIKIILGSYHGTWMTRIIEKLNGHHEPQEEAAFYEVLKLIKPNSTMVELGSFWAYYSLWFNNSISGAKNILIEPSLINLETGKKNFFINDSFGTFINAAIGKDSIGLVEFKLADGSTKKVPSTSIDFIMKDLNIEKIHLLHSDIQGAETNMLIGATDALKNKKIDFLFISTHGCEHKKVLRELKINDYNIILEHSILESFSADGLIVASADRVDLKIKISRRRASIFEVLRDRLACLKNAFLVFFR